MSGCVLAEFAGRALYKRSPNLVRPWFYLVNPPAAWPGFSRPLSTPVHEHVHKSSAPPARPFSRHPRASEHLARASPPPDEAAKGSTARHLLSPRPCLQQQDDGGTREQEVLLDIRELSVKYVGSVFKVLLDHRRSSNSKQSVGLSARLSSCDELPRPTDSSSRCSWLALHLPALKNAWPAEASSLASNPPKARRQRRRGRSPALERSALGIC
eukprot:scaffold23769_cov63-Phaeocystis_antarctica.AAC.3